MGYDPQYYNPLYGENPYSQMPTQRRTMHMPQILGDQLIMVNGEAGLAALAKNMGPNSRAAAFDANEDILYIITTDGAAYPSWQTFDFYLRNNAQPTQACYVSQNEFNKFKEDIKEVLENVKQLVQGSKPSGAAVPTAAARTEL